MGIYRCDLDPSEFVAWKHPVVNPVYGSQVIVNQSQQVALFSSGQLAALLSSGAHTLVSPEIPVLNDLLQDGTKSLPLEVWFINKVFNTNFKWGTRNPIQIQEYEYRMPISIGSHGTYECNINDIQAFILKVVGVRDVYRVDDLRTFLFPLVEREVKNELSSFTSNNSVFSIPSFLKQCSELVLDSLKLRFEDYGVLLSDFYVQDIAVSSDDPGYAILKESLSEVSSTKLKAEAESIKIKIRAEAESAKIKMEAEAESESLRLKAEAIQSAIEGYKAERSFDVLEKLSESNGGLAAALAGAGFGVGAGINLGKTLLDSLSGDSSFLTNLSSESNPSTKKLLVLKELLSKNLISQSEYDTKLQMILKDL